MGYLAGAYTRKLKTLVVNYKIVLESYYLLMLAI